MIERIFKVSFDYCQFHQEHFFAKEDEIEAALPRLKMQFARDSERDLWNMSRMRGYQAETVERAIEEPAQRLVESGNIEVFIAELELVEGGVG